MIEKAVVLIVPFITNTLLIRNLGIEYAGIGNVFKAITGILLIGNLGFEEAVISCMYKAFAEEDKQTISAYVHHFKRLYRKIGCVVVLLSIMTLPFLPYITRHSELSKTINIYICFAMYLSEGLIKYFFSGHLRTVPVADQKIRLLNSITVITLLAKCILQCFFLTKMRSYYLYLLVIPIITLIYDSLVRYSVYKAYPYLRMPAELDDNAVDMLNQKIKGVVIHHFAGKTRNETDSLCVSAFIGLTAAGIYGNYMQIISGLSVVFSAISDALTPSVGNSLSLETEDKNFRDMNKIDFIYISLSSIAAVCLLCLFQPFMYMWMGQDLMLENSSVVAFTVLFYLLRLGDIRYIYIKALGLWYETRYLSVLEMLSNIALNIYLCKNYGVTGIIFATIISVFFFNYISFPIVLFKTYFKTASIYTYFWEHIKYSLVTIISAAICWHICLSIPYVVFSATGVMYWLSRMLVCTIVTLILYTIAFRKKISQSIREIFPC